MTGAAAVARLRAMSLREKGLVAACVLLFAGIAVVNWGILPAKARHERNVAAMKQRLAAIERYEAYRKGQGRAEEDRGRLAEQLAKWENGLLVGESASAAGVFLQGLLKPLTQKPQTRVTAIRALPPVRKGPYTEIAVQLDIQTSTDELAQILADISRQPKLLHVRKFSAGTAGYAGRPQMPRETINVSMVVSGLSSAPPVDKPATGDATP